MPVIRYALWGRASREGILAPFQLDFSMPCNQRVLCLQQRHLTLPPGSGAQLPDVLLKQKKQKQQKYTLKKRQSLTMVMGNLGGGREGRGKRRGGRIFGSKKSRRSKRSCPSLRTWEAGWDHNSAAYLRYFLGTYMSQLEKFTEKLVKYWVESNFKISSIDI